MRHVKYILIVIAICVAALSILHLLYIKGFNKFYAFEQGKVHEIMEGKTDYDVVFVGSSRTFYHINPKVVDTVLHMNSYNAGMDGANLLEMNMIIKSYLHQHKAPRLLVLEIPAPGFAIGLKPIFNPNMYYSYLGNKVVFETLEPYQRVYVLKYLPFLQITQADDALKQAALYGHLNKKSINPAKTYKGFKPNGNDTLSTSYKRIKSIYPIENRGVKMLQEIIEVCKQYNTKLVFTYAPHYKLVDEEMNPQFFPTIQQVRQGQQIPFLNYRYHPISKQHTLFEDVRHLNKNGADLYSAVIANDIKPLL